MAIQEEWQSCPPQDQVIVDRDTLLQKVQEHFGEAGKEEIAGVIAQMQDSPNIHTANDSETPLSSDLSGRPINRASGAVPMQQLISKPQVEPASSSFTRGPNPIPRPSPSSYLPAATEHNVPPAWKLSSTSSPLAPKEQHIPPLAPEAADQAEAEPAEQNRSFIETARTSLERFVPVIKERRERQERERELVFEWNDNHYELQERGKLVKIMPIIVFATKGAGAKSVTAVNLATTLAYHQDRHVLLTDFDSPGSVASRLGYIGDDCLNRVQLAEYLDKTDQNDRQLLKWFNERTVPTQRLDFIAGSRDRLDAARTRKVVDAVQDLAPCRIFDMANDDDLASQESQAVLQAVQEQGGVIIFTCNVGIKDSISRLEGDMYNLSGNFGKLIESSVVVINNVQDPGEFEDAKKTINDNRQGSLETQYRKGRTYPYKGDFVRISYDPLLEEAGRYDLWRLNLKTKVDFQRVAIATQDVQLGKSDPVKLQQLRDARRARWEEFQKANKAA